MATRNDIAELYVGYFNRAPDPAGLDYWLEQSETMTLAEIAESFSVQPEATELYGFLEDPEGSSAEAFIDAVYLNLFGRAADEGGKQYWLDQLEGGTPVGEMIVDIMSGAQDTEEFGQDATILANKVEAGLYWTDQFATTGETYVDEDGEIVPEFEAAAKGALDGVDETDESVEESQDETDSFIADVTAPQPVEGEEFFLTNLGDAFLQDGTRVLGFDDLTGTVGNDTFIAEDTRLQSDDRVDGGSGYDELLWTKDDGNDAENPTIRNVEGIVISDQDGNGSTDGDNNLSNDGISVDLDAGRISGTTRWESFDSRGDVVIEDARDTTPEDGTFTRDMTVAMVSTDPGNVDFAVYFDDPQNTTERNDVITIEVIDQNNSEAHDADAITATTAGNLEDAQLLEFRFVYNDEVVTITLDPEIVGTDHFGASATYSDLVTAINLALDENETVAGDVTAELSDVAFEENIGNDNPNAGSEEFVFGRQINLTSNSGAELGDAGAGDITVISRNDPADTAQSIVADPNLEEELISLKVVLDDVGKGSAGGDLVAGAMSTGTQLGDDAKSDSIGIQLFNIHVDQTSNLQTISSTNNSLEEVFIDNADNATARGDANDTADGDLIVRGLTVRDQGFSGALNLGGVSTITAFAPPQGGANQPMPGAGPQHASTFGFTDVRLIDATDMEGSVDITAVLTDEIVEKYLDLQDTQDDQGDDNETFSYSLSGQADEFLLAMSDNALTDAGTGAREDFELSVAGNGGDDVLTTLVGETVKFIDEQGQDWFGMFATGVDADDNGILDWYENQNAPGVGPMAVTGGAGEDEIWTFGWGDYRINAGADNDVVYADNSGVNWIPLVPDLNPVIGRQVGEHNQIDYAVNAVWTFNDDNGDTDGIGDIKGTTNDTVFTASANAAQRDYVLTVSFNTTTNGAAEDTAFTSTVEISAGREENVTDAMINQKIKEAINDDAKLSTVLEAQDGPGQSLLVYSKIDGVAAETDLSVAINELDDDGDIAEADVGTYEVSGFAQFGTDSGAYSESVVIGGAGDDVLVLSTSANASQDVRFGTDFGADTLFHFNIAGVEPLDTMSFTAFNPVDGDGDGVAKSLTVGSFDDTNGAISIVAETVDNDTAAEVADAFDDTDDFESFLAIVYDDNANDTADEPEIDSANNTGTVYLVSGGETASAEELGTIDLIGVEWESLTESEFGI